MGRLYLLTAASLGLFFLAHHDADAQNKAKKPANTVDKATPEDYKLLRQAKEVTGKLAFADANSRILTLRLEIPHMEPNPNFKKGGGDKGGNNNQMQNLYRQQAEIMRIQNPIQRQQRMQQLMQQMQKQQYQQMMQAAKAQNQGNNTPFRLVKDNKDFELQVSETAVIRKMFLPRDFDDRGFLKDYSKEEIAKLKGKDTTKPGYEARIEELVNGQTVRLFLGAAAAKKPEAKADAIVEGVGNVARPTVSTIYILEDSTEPVFTPGPKKKAK